jgi:hypothetical protein
LRVSFLVALDVILDLTPENLHAMSEAIRSLKLSPDDAKAQ